MIWFLAPFLFLIHPALSILFQLLIVRNSFRPDKFSYLRVRDLSLFIVLSTAFYLQSFLIHNSLWQDVRLLFLILPFVVFRFIDLFKISRIVIAVSLASVIFSIVQFVF